MKKVLTVLAVFLMLVGWCGAANNLMPLPQEMQGRYGATHYIDISAGALFDGMATNVTYTNTYPIIAGTTVRFVAYELLTPFSGGAAAATTLTNATVTFGTEDSATAFLAATQIGTNSTIWWSAGVPSVASTPTVTVTLLKGTNTVIYSGSDTNVLTTNTFIAVTNVTVSATVASTATQGTLYSAATNLMVCVAPYDGLSMDWATHGQLRLFIQKREPYGK